ncbi:MAG TPA: DUF488 domain-containing protein [Limnochordales bacterium]
MSGGRVRVASVGHGSRSLQAMRELLVHWGVTCVADVRRFPSSARFPHFAAAAMSRWLAEAGVRYVPMGESLGGFRPGGYEAWMKTARFQEGLAELARLARQEQERGGLVAFLCSERLPWRCHRRFIARALAEEGFEVVHLMDGGRVWRPASRPPTLPEGLLG